MAALYTNTRDAVGHPMPHTHILSLIAIFFIHFSLHLPPTTIRVVNITVFCIIQCAAWYASWGISFQIVRRCVVWSSLTDISCVPTCLNAAETQPTKLRSWRTITCDCLSNCNVTATFFRMSHQ